MYILLNTYSLGGGENMEKEDSLNKLKNKINNIPNFPKPGIHFRDITPILTDSESFNNTITLLKEHYKSKNIEAVVAVEPRGFIVGASLAVALGAAFIPIRRKGKSNMTLSKEYGLDYRLNILEIPNNSIKRGERVLFFDDVLAGGATAKTVIKSIEKTGAEIVGLSFLIELTSLKARSELKDYEVHSLIKFKDR